MKLRRVSGNLGIVEDVEVESRGRKRSSIEFRGHNAITHLGQVIEKLSVSSSIIDDQTRIAGGASVELQQFLGKLTNTLEAIRLRHRMDGRLDNEDFKTITTIDQETGFPYFAIDFVRLEQDKSIADRMVNELPDMASLAHIAEELLFREAFPVKPIYLAQQREYFSLLRDSELATGIQFQPAINLGKKDNGHMYLKTFSRLDTRENLPRFYALLFHIPSRFFSGSHWEGEVEAAAMYTIHSTLSAFEMPNLAVRLENIDGIHLKMIERTDVGPFYNRNTVQDQEIDAVLRVGSKDDTILRYTKWRVLRSGEHRQGFLEKVLPNWLYGRTGNGIFTKQQLHADAAIMSHRQIQKVYARKLPFAEKYAMFGTSVGEHS